MTNPWISFWFEATNNYARGIQDFWIGEFQRHQAALLQESARQGNQTWMNAWTVLPMDLMKRGFAKTL
jgi:hypothetical protein